MREGSRFAHCNDRDIAEQMRTTCEDEENKLWKMTPVDRVAILKGKKHELHYMANFLESMFQNFRTHRRRP